MLLSRPQSVKIFFFELIFLKKSIPLKLLFVVNVFFRMVTCLWRPPFSKHLISGAADGSLNVWSFRNGRLIHSEELKIDNSKVDFFIFFFYLQKTFQSIVSWIAGSQKTSEIAVNLEKFVLMFYYIVFCFYRFLNFLVRMK